MKFYTDPVVSVLSWPNFEEPSHLRVKWLGDSTNAERLVEYSGRLCYMSQANPGGKTTEQYLDNILEMAHGSVTEHANITMLFEGISRSLTHELVRHRAGFAYSQLSQRYVDESDCDMVIPPAIQEAPDFIRKDWVASMLEMGENYRNLVNALMEQYKDEPDSTARKKKAREAARSVLPNATETKIVVTANVRAWRHFLELRGSLGADREIRKLAFACLPKLQKVAPRLFGDFTINNGEIKPRYHKV